MSIEDQSLLDAAARGETAAFRTLVETHLPTVLATARRILGDATEAEDIAQETLLRLWRRSQEIDVGAAGIAPWLRRVAANLAIDRWRSRRRIDADADVADERAEDTDAPTAVERLVEQDLADRVHRAMADLPERQRVALSLFHFEEMSQREVAAMMEVSEDALESLLARARRKLKADLADDWQGLLPGTD